MLDPPRPFSSGRYDLRVPNTYDVESLGPGGRYAVERLAEIADVTSANRVLEVGSGHGVAAIHLAETRQCRIVATDSDIEKLERLQRRVLSLNLEGLIDAWQLDCTKPWPHSSDSFDLVFAGSVLDRVENMETPIREAFRVLRPGGYFAIYGAVWKRDEVRDEAVIRALGPEVQSLADYELRLTEDGFRIAASRLLPDHLWADYYRQYVDELEHEVEYEPDVPLPWVWYEEAAIVLTHLDVIGVGLVVGRKPIDFDEIDSPLEAFEALELEEVLEVPR